MTNHILNDEDLDAVRGASWMDAAIARINSAKAEAAAKNMALMDAATHTFHSGLARGGAQICFGAFGR